ncbi:MAG: AzlC family ABC transporter permease [Oscillospiraceae bacterium]
MSKTMRAAFRATVPILFGYLCIGMAYGLLFVHAGFSPLLAVLSSLLVYAGAMQFVAIGFLTAGVGLAEMFAVTLTANLRHIFYGLSMLTTYQGEGRRKPYLIFSLTDETYSLLCTGETPPGADPSDYRLFVSLFNQAYWVAGTLLGAVAGELLVFDSTGIDFAMTALFLVICVDQWRTAATHLPMLLGLGCSLGGLALAGAQRFMIPALLAMSGLLLLLRGRLEPMLDRSKSEEAPQ